MTIQFQKRLKVFSRKKSWIELGFQIDSDEQSECKVFANFYTVLGGILSSIHRLLGREATVTSEGRACSLFDSPESANPYRLGRAGQGRTSEAETVTTLVRKVRPKRTETSVLRFRVVRRN
jgi:hypothetical protein